MKPVYVCAQNPPCHLSTEHIFVPLLACEDQNPQILIRQPPFSPPRHLSALFAPDKGKVYMWGCGRHGKLCLGENTFSSQFAPVVVQRLRNLTAVLVTCGGCHTMVLGYRRRGGEISPPHGNSPPASSLSNLARDALPPLKPGGLPPLRQSVLPAVPDADDGASQSEDEDEPLAGEDDQLPPRDGGAIVGWSSEAPKTSGQDADGVQELRESMDGNLSRFEKKGGRFAKLFTGWRKKKNPAELHSLDGAKDETQGVIKTDQPRKSEDVDEPAAASEKILPVKEEDELSQTFLAGNVGDASISETARINSTVLGHKQSRACTIL